ncbi:SulP family inorganic anion transporter [Marinobacterium sedimentorum]|uniref:SulP family inorganic anion transporter n=1 Tax=Marinobacterium sedimentorum TaxID=2927804 RepID=UPI0020C61B93|nr:sulfate permease [Marinobacterium sedimentorum]MCP8690490.1 sulfate permease [Marinobacterium sedimentorum]
MKRFFPILQWLPQYRRDSLASDLLAAVIVTIMLIPQSLAYALLAGLPAEAGLYASILPLIAYAVFGTSRTLAVGPVAVVSLMTAAVAGQVALQGSIGYINATVLLALISGLMLLAMGLLRLGFVANFLSHPVISGFISASGLIIATSQLQHLLGVQASGHNLWELLQSLWQSRHNIHGITFTLGAACVLFLLLVRRWLKPGLLHLGCPPQLADLITKAGPIITVIGATALTAWLNLATQGLRILGTIPAGLPALTVPHLSLALLEQLWLPALLISTIGFVESVSVAQTLAAKRRQRIDPDQELIGLGACNIASSLSGGFPVTGGFSRSVVNFDAGAATPAAGAFTAVGIALATLFLTPLIYFLPLSVLAATIMVAVLSLVDLGAIRRTWRYSRHDGVALLATLLATLLTGVTSGVIIGVVLSLLLYLHRTSRPHSAIVGRMPDTEHFRNVERHEVETDPALCILRIDEGLYFANTRFLEDRIYAQMAAQKSLRHLILMCPGVNHIDASALEALEAINARLQDAGIELHLSEVKGPVADALRNSDFLEHLSGRIFLSTYLAWRALHKGPAD